MEFLALLALALAIIALVKISTTRNRLDPLAGRIATLESELRRLRERSAEASPPKIAPTPAPPPAAEPTPVAQPPPLPAFKRHAFPERTVPPELERKRPVVETPPAVALPSPPKQPTMPINWELFMGAKLFAWIGGLALFLGVAFFVKYSFDHNLISPAMRVAIGFVVGAGLLVGGTMVE